MPDSNDFLVHAIQLQKRKNSAELIKYVSKFDIEKVRSFIEASKETAPSYDALINALKTLLVVPNYDGLYHAPNRKQTKLAAQEASSDEKNMLELLVSPLKREPQTKKLYLILEHLQRRYILRKPFFKIIYESLPPPKSLFTYFPLHIVIRHDFSFTRFLIEELGQKPTLYYQHGEWNNIENALLEYAFVPPNSGKELIAVFRYFCHEINEKFRATPAMFEKALERGLKYSPQFSSQFKALVNTALKENWATKPRKTLFDFSQIDKENIPLKGEKGSERHHRWSLFGESIKVKQPLDKAHDVSDGAVKSQCTQTSQTL